MYIYYRNLFLCLKKAIRAVFNLPYNNYTNEFFKNNTLHKLNGIYKHKAASIM